MFDPEDFFPEEILEELEDTDTSLYDILPEELLQYLEDEDDRNHWDRYDEMPWNG
ncbi:hypothetical protein HWB76_gp122 [Streptomyces phage Blueeyedbeauty]|uniref:Uncharacterized protein n=1 Tax=Streptomyces phage Blueeyedbeauty TaxID=2250336 RepID=A0A345L1X8_9CAUD|nr:hypothetical protein HWB76_gp122 [Streptomyces phage Blueeyedbeauty]AXH49280.1 hypothetical protein SEA_BLUEEYEDBEAUTY_164 [Streptomyces phage Blueeyedbeauty]